jgi:hypothetical protein
MKNTSTRFILNSFFVNQKIYESFPMKPFRAKPPERNYLVENQLSTPEGYTKEGFG